MDDIVVETFTLLDSHKHAEMQDYSGRWTPHRVREDTGRVICRESGPSSGRRTTAATSPIHLSCIQP